MHQAIELDKAFVAKKVMILGEKSQEVSKITQLIDSLAECTNNGLEKVSQAVQVIKGISNSTKQQKTGAEQVVEAFMNIDDVTSTFAATTKQTAAHATELGQMSKKLKDAISGFKLDDNASNGKKNDNKTINFDSIEDLRS